MTYSQVADMRDSRSLARRIAACAAKEGFLTDAETWASRHSWQWAATAGWDDKWASAVAAENPDPGGDDAVITDGDILARVQQIGDDPAVVPGA